jgi:ribosome biogenesis GTPase
MKLEDLGYHSALETYRKENGLDSLEVGRVLVEHKNRYVVATASHEFDAELMGNLRFTAENRNDLPAVGDWVAFMEYDEDKALIHAVFPRKSLVERKAVGKSGQTQIIASNIDFGLIVQSVNRDFNMNRLERYLTICYASKIEPIVILSKVDLIEKKLLDELMNQVKARMNDVSVFAISNTTLTGIDELKSKLKKGFTYCLLGSSGAGKSTLMNTLSGSQLMKTGEISKSVQRGKHVTSHRELFVLDFGILIDNPGMREVGITNMSDGLENTFDDISNLALDCKFNNCTHTSEKGCAVLDAIANQKLNVDSYTNFMKMENERRHFESDALERKKKDKDLGKLIKRVKKIKKNTKY